MGNEKEKFISFDLVFNFDENNPTEIVNTIKKNLSVKYPKYTFGIIIDADISD